MIACSGASVGVKFKFAPFAQIQVHLLVGPLAGARAELRAKLDASGLARRLKQQQ